MEDKSTAYFSKDVGYVGDYNKDCYNEFDNPYDNSATCVKSAILEIYKLN